MIDKGTLVRITEAEDGTRSTTRRCYAVDDEAWWDTHGTRWPLVDNDQYRYTTLTEDNQ